jgi:hypothetical protein
MNEYAIGRHRAVKLVASVERAGHQTMVARLKGIRRTVMLTGVQAKELEAELAWRSAKIKDLTRLIHNCQRGIDQQYGKPSAPRVDDLVRIQSTVAGPSGFKSNAKIRKKNNPQTFETQDGIVHSLSGTLPAKVNINVRATAWFPDTSATHGEANEQQQQQEQA